MYRIYTVYVLLNIKRHGMHKRCIISNNINQTILTYIQSYGAGCPCGSLTLRWSKLSLMLLLHQPVSTTRLFLQNQKYCFWPKLSHRQFLKIHVITVYVKTLNTNS